jgi:hypothetical protein
MDLKMVRPSKGNASLGRVEDLDKGAAHVAVGGFCHCGSMPVRSPMKSDTNSARECETMWHQLFRSRLCDLVTAGAAICATWTSPRRGGRTLPVKPTRSPPRSSKMALASASVRAILVVPSFRDVNDMEADWSTHIRIDWAICHSLSWMNCASSAQSGASQYCISWFCAGRYCQNVSPTPARRRP